MRAVLLLLLMGVSVPASAQYDDYFSETQEHRSNITVETEQERWQKLHRYNDNDDFFYSQQIINNQRDMVQEMREMNRNLKRLRTGDDEPHLPGPSLFDYDD